MRHVGIDISKSTLSVAQLEPAWSVEVPNTKAGIQRIIKKLRGQATRVAVEATASYGFDLVEALAGAEGVEVMVANPRATRNFAKSTRQRGKTDRADSAMLARFAFAMEFVPWTPPSAPAKELRDVMRRRKQLVDQMGAEKKRLKELCSQQRPNAFVVEDLKDHIAHLERRVKRLEKQALAVVKQDPALDAWRERLNSAPGVADVTSLGVISELACLPPDMDARQLTAFTGLDPQPWQSGNMDAARRISKRGNKRLRTSLFLAAWNTTRCSPHVAAWRERLIKRGKAPKVATIAVARRLLHAFAAMRKSEQSWDGEAFHPLAA